MSFEILTLLMKDLAFGRCEMSAIKIRLADVSEGPQVVEMINAAFKDETAFLPIERDLKWWKWKYEEIPFGKPLISVADDDGRIAGAQICWPWSLTYAGHELKTYQLVDTSVHPDYRGHGLFLKLTINSVKVSNEANADLIFGFPNKNALHGYLKLYYDKVFPVYWWIKVLKPVKLIDKKARHASGRSIDLPAEYRITEEKANKIRFANPYERRIQIKGSSEYVIWRYVRHPLYKYGIVFDKGKGISCAIFEIRETINNYREMIVLEIYGSTKQYPEVLSELVAVARSSNVSMIAIIDPHDFESKDSFKQKHFIKAKNKLFYTVPTKLELEPLTSDVANWRLVAGFHDAV